MAALLRVLIHFPRRIVLDRRGATRLDDGDVVHRRQAERVEPVRAVDRHERDAVVDPVDEDERFGHFVRLPKSAGSVPPRATVWQRLEMAEAALRDTRSQLQSTAALAIERLKQLDGEQARRTQIEQKVGA